MSRLFICTTGTSIANGCPSQRQMLTSKSSWDDDASRLRQEIRSALKAPEMSPATPTGRRRLCAELNTLDRAGISSDDSVVLLASDTAQGRVCAEMIKESICSAYGIGEAAVVVRRIEGLQVTDARTLRERGLKNLVRVVLEYLAGDEYRYSHEIVLNPTGGFKGIVPFLTILGMLFGRRTIYVFEFSDELINLPPLPFSFDLPTFRRVKPALQLIDQEIAVSEQAYLEKIPGYVPAERDLFMAYTEPFDETRITISPLAYCLLRVEAVEPFAMISRKALSSFERVRGTARLALGRLILNSQDPLWRNAHIKRWEGLDLFIIKRARTAERIAGFMYDNRFLVTHVFAEHEEYERTLGEYSKNDFPPSEFVRWEPDQDLGADDDDTHEVVEQRDRLLLETEELRAKILNGERRNQTLSGELAASVRTCEEIRQAAHAVTEANEILSKKVATLTQTVEELEKELNVPPLRRWINGLLGRINQKS